MLKPTFFLFLGCQIFQTVSPLKVSIYYESLSRESQAFITTQFYPTYQLLKDVLEVEFVPFGLATMFNTTGTFNFQCDNGAAECQVNKFHCCVLDSNPGEAVEFINCDMALEDPSDEFLIEECANQLGLWWVGIWACVYSGQSEFLLAESGMKTLALDPKISVTPTLLFDDEYDLSLQNMALHNFFETVCWMFEKTPDICLPIVVRE